MASLNNTTHSRRKKKGILLSVEVIIAPLLFTTIIGVCCEWHTKSKNRIYSNNSVSNIEARGIYINHCGLCDFYRNNFFILFFLFLSQDATTCPWGHSVAGMTGATNSVQGKRPATYPLLMLRQCLHGTVWLCPLGFSGVKLERSLQVLRVLSLESPRV